MADNLFGQGGPIPGGGKKKIDPEDLLDANIPDSRKYNAIYDWENEEWFSGDQVGDLMFEGTGLENDNFDDYILIDD